MKQIVKKEEKVNYFGALVEDQNWDAPIVEGAGIYKQYFFVGLYCMVITDGIKMQIAVFDSNEHCIMFNTEYGADIKQTILDYIVSE